MERLRGAVSLFLLCLGRRIGAHPAFMFGDYCQTALIEGAVIMHNKAKVTSECWPVVARGAKALRQNAHYAAGEVLRVGVSSKGDSVGEWLAETYGGEFRFGQCLGRRRSMPREGEPYVELIMPKDEYDVVVWVAHATSFGPVALTHNFTLKGAKGARPDRASVEILPAGPDLPASDVDTASTTSLRKPRFFCKLHDAEGGKGEDGGEQQP